MNKTKVLETAKKLAEEFITQLGLDADITAEWVEGDSIPYILVKYEGEHLGELFGFHGRIFDSIQNVLNLMLSKELGEDKARILLEINEYRNKREEYLTKYARRAAEEVRMTGQAMELTPMKAFERRIIHMTLKDDEDVKTESVGEGRDRRLKILPRN